MFKGLDVDSGVESVPKICSFSCRIRYIIQSTHSLVPDILAIGAPSYINI